MKHRDPVFFAKRSLLSLAVLTAFSVSCASAATITVDTTVDKVGGGSGTGCSLRDAVISINTATTQPSCAAVGAYDPATDTINLPAGTYNLTITGLDEGYTGSGPYTVVNTPDASKGDIDIQRSMRIVGAGADNTIIRWDDSVSDANRDRIFHVYTTDTVTVKVALDAMTITGGRTTEQYIADGPAGSDPAVPTKYYLRRAGGGLAVGPAAGVVQIDPALEGSENSAGRGGSLKPGESDPSGATFNLTLNGLKVLANHADGDGAGIYNASPMTATNIVVANNVSTVNGGGMYDEGQTFLINSTFSGNKAEGGGAMFLTGSNIVNISGSTLSGNYAIGGGGISGRSSAPLYMTNSTISGNLAEDVGAGFNTNGAATLKFVTVANNIAGAVSPGSGAGIVSFPSGSVSVTLQDTLVAGNKKDWEFGTYANPADDPTLTDANCGYTGGGANNEIKSAGHNLSSDTSCATYLYDTSDKNNVNPLIGALADNGGTTQTHALLGGSPALGAGAAIAGVTLDQRGVTRDATPDIGAYEVPTAATTTSSGGGGGGCTVNPNGGFDAGLLALLGTAMAGLFLRRRQRKTVHR